AGPSTPRDDSLPYARRDTTPAQRHRRHCTRSPPSLLTSLSIVCCRHKGRARGRGTLGQTDTRTVQVVAQGALRVTGTRTRTSPGCERTFQLRRLPGNPEVGSAHT